MGVTVSQYIWCAKLPTKIKVFMWYLKKGVILTKVNLVRRNWHGDKSCAYYHVPESIQHLFFSCAHAKFLWRAVHVVFGLSQPSSVDDLFNRWCKVGGIKHNLLLLTVASAICWTIWISRNEVVFDKCELKSYLQVLFRGMYWLRQWALLQRHEHQHALVLQCQQLEKVVLRVFASFGWLLSSRLGLH